VRAKLPKGQSSLAQEVERVPLADVQSRLQTELSVQEFSPSQKLPPLGW